MTTPRLKKTCTICGEQKPLAAFRSLSGTRGPLYSNICASCRSSGADKKIKKETDDGTTSRTGHQIDSKSKVYSDTEKKDSFEKELEEYHKERDEDAALEDQRLEDKSDTAKKEREHRESFLDKDKSRQKDATKKEAQKEAQTRKAEQDHRRQGMFNRETANRSEVARQEEVRLGHDFSVPYFDTGISQLKHQSDVYLRFRTLVGGHSPMGQEQINKQTGEQQTTEEKLKEDIDNKWSPSSGRRR